MKKDGISIFRIDSYICQQRTDLPHGERRRQFEGPPIIVRGGDNDFHSAINQALTEAPHCTFCGEIMSPVLDRLEKMR